MRIFILLLFLSSPSTGPLSLSGECCSPKPWGARPVCDHCVTTKNPSSWEVEIRTMCYLRLFFNTSCILATLKNIKWGLLISMLYLI